MNNDKENPLTPKPPPKPPKHFPGLGKKEEEKPTPKPTTKSSAALNITRTCGGLLLGLGLFLMVKTLLGYDTSVCTYEDDYQGGVDKSCVYNSGKIGEKNDLILFSGFLFVGGCVLFSKN